MASPLSAIFKSIKRLVANPIDQELAVERAKKLSELIDLSRYSPSAIGRATTESPAAQRGFSESMASTKRPFATALIRPSQWAEHTPPLDERRDANILEYLRKVLPEEKLKELPFLWVNDRPGGLEAGYEGRHRMRAMQDLYGDDPVLVNALRGDQFKNVELDYPKGVWDERVVDDNRLSPLEMLKREIMMGDKPISIDPLWRSQK